jgi:hypothetical protein
VLILNQGEERFAWSLPPILAAVKGVLRLFAMDKTVEAADHEIGVLIVQRRPVRHDIHLPAFEQGSDCSPKSRWNAWRPPGLITSERNSTRCFMVKASEKEQREPEDLRRV